MGIRVMHFGMIGLMGQAKSVELRATLTGEAADDPSR